MTCVDFPRRDVGDEDVRRVVEVGDVRDLRARRRPRRRGDRRALRRLERLRRVRARIDERERRAGAHGHRARAIRLHVDLQVRRGRCAACRSRGCRRDRASPCARTTSGPGSAIVNEMSVRGAVMIRSTTAGGLTQPSFFRTSSGFQPWAAAIAGSHAIDAADKTRRKVLDRGAAGLMQASIGRFRLIETTTTDTDGHAPVLGQGSGRIRRTRKARATHTDYRRYCIGETLDTLNRSEATLPM